jgi:hypothetical protein
VTDRPRERLREHLLASRIAGDVATSRESNLGNIKKMLDREWDYWFGVELGKQWSADEVLAIVADQVGIDPDPGRRFGADRIDPEKTLAALDAMAARLHRAVDTRERVLIATGHPTGLLSLHLALARELAAAGCELLTPAAEARIERRGRIRYLDKVAMLSNGADFLHSHAAEPMQLMLELGPRPDLVIADHGFAGVAAEAGIETIGFADTNDPALFVAVAEGKLDIVVPLDDNVPPDGYLPIADYLVAPIRHDSQALTRSE